MTRKIGINEIQKIETAMLREVDRILRQHNITYYLCCGSVLGAIRHKGPIPWDSDLDIVIPFSEFTRAYQFLKKEISAPFFIDDYMVTKRFGRLVPRVGLQGNSSLYLHVDIFPLVGVPEDRKLLYRFHRKSTMLNRIMYYKHVRKQMVKPYKRPLLAILQLLLGLISDKLIVEVFMRHCGKYSYDNAKYVMNPTGHYGLKNVIEKTIFGQPQYVEYDGIYAPIPEKYDIYLSHYYGDYMKYPAQKIQEKGLQFSIEIND